MSFFTLRLKKRMRTQYLIAAIAAAAISITMPLGVRAEMPSELKPCLAANPLYTTPKQYREFARVSAGTATYHYLYAIFKPSEIPMSVALIKVEGGSCHKLGQSLSTFDGIGKLVPSNVAIALTEAKWRSIQKFKGGAQFIKDLLHPSSAPDSSGEALIPISLSSLDRQVLSRIVR
jgi:hypothetical protein